MPRYRVDPRQVREVRMKDGTRYPVPLSGVVSVAHRHEDEMRRSPTMSGNVNGEMLAVGLTMPGGHGRDCPSCGFSGWPWQESCPRDGAALAR